MAIALSVLGIAVGPALLALGRGSDAFHVTVDGFVLGLMPTLIAFRILPHLYAQVGTSAIALMAAGYLGFWIVSRSNARLRFATSLAVATFTIHSLLDGASLAIASRSGGGSALPLTFGLVTHRLPEGLFVGTLLLPRFGIRGMTAVTILLAASTAFGAISGQRILAHVDHNLLHAIVAVGMGAMLRVAFHQHASPPPKKDLALGTLGFLAGAVLAIVVPVANDDEPTVLSVHAQQ